MDHIRKSSAVGCLRTALASAALGTARLVTACVVFEVRASSLIFCRPSMVTNFASGSGRGEWTVNMSS